MTFTTGLLAGALGGLLAGWATADRVVPRVRAWRASAQLSAQGLSRRATRTSTGRYVRDLVRAYERQHLFGALLPLSAVLVEPRFLPLPKLAEPPDDDDVAEDVFHVVPHVPDMPFLAAPYNVPAFRVEDLARGDRKLALLGVPGSGRTTALLSLALWSLGAVQFAPAPDPVQAQLDAEEAQLSAKERQARSQDRDAMLERAREQLEQAQAATEADASGTASLSRLLPIYAHALDLDVSPQEYGPAVDPAEPLVRAVQHQVGTVTASTIPTRLYRRLAAGTALVLIDGLDDLPAGPQRRVLAWLRAFLDQYGQNMIIVAGPVRGAGALVQLGLTPMLMAPWNAQEVRLAADLWAEAWSSLPDDARPTSRPAVSAVARASESWVGLTPADVVLRTWGLYSGLADTTPMACMLAYVAQHLPKQQSFEQLEPLLRAAGALQVDTGVITRRGLDALMRQISGEDAPADAPELPDAPPQQDAAPDAAAARKDAQKEPGRLFAALVRRGLLLTTNGQRAQFRHPLVAAALASLTLHTASGATLAQRATAPEWHSAMAYAAAHTDITAAVQACLNADASMLQAGLLDVARWLAYAPQDVPWRNTVLRTVGAALLSPSQYPYLRARAAAALVAARDTATAQAAFRAGLNSADADVRRLCALGLGATGGAASVPQLAALLNDSVQDVQLAAGMALVAVGSDEALDAAASALGEGSERLRQALAESFAATPDAGYPTLYEAMQHEDYLLRRSAVYGLRRVPTRWAREAVYRIFINDAEWYVRSAAQSAFQAQEEGVPGPRAYPPAEAIDWLQTWAEARGLEVPRGERAVAMLAKALTDPQPNVRALAAQVAGQLALTQAAGTLYQALHDPQEPVRAAASDALAALQLAVGEPLPAPFRATP